MNKSELIAAISENVGTTKAAVEKVLSELGNVANNLSVGEELILPGIGKLKIAEKGARNARNPKTGEILAIPAKNVVKFVAAKVFKDNIQ